jgi:anti-anti-sigma factor
MNPEHALVDTNPPTMDVRRLGADVAQVILGGEHDLSSADELNTVLAQTLEQCSHIVVDLSSTTFIDSTTIRVLITTKGRADASGRRFNLLLGTAPIVERVLELTGVLTALNRVHTLDEALRGSSHSDARTAIDAGNATC